MPLTHNQRQGDPTAAFLARWRNLSYGQRPTFRAQVVGNTEVTLPSISWRKQNADSRTPPGTQFKQSN